MGRRAKKGLDYFLFDINMIKDEGVMNLCHTFGPAGFRVYITLLCEIYRCGYYKKTDAAYLASLARELQISRKRIVNMIGLMVNCNLFNKSFYDDANILTNFDIQRQYFTVKYKRITDETLNGYEYLLFENKKQTNEANKVEKKGVSSLKKSRVEKSRVEKNINTTTTTTTTHDEAIEAIEVFEIENDAECETAYAKESEIKTENETRIPQPENQQARQNRQIAEKKAAKKGGGDPIANNRPATGKQAANGASTAAQSTTGHTVTVKSFADCIRLFRENLMPSEDWQAALVRTSGKGVPILGEVEAVLLHFESHILVNSMGYNILNEHEFARRFISWWRCMDYKTAAEIGADPSLRTADSNGGRRGRNQGGRSPVVRESRIDSMMEMKEQIEANALKMMQSC